MEVVANNYLPGDQRLVDKIVYELKAQGIFDQFRKECFADVDTKPAYQNLRQRVEGSVAGFLKEQSWRPDMNKNQVREMLRKTITESGFLETGVERIVDQVVNPKINTVFLPKVEEVVYSYLGIKKPNRNEQTKNDCDLLPTDLEAVSPESETIDKKDESFPELDENKTEEDESPPFEPLEEQSVYVPHEENSVDSHMSGFSGLISHESNQSNENKVTPMEQDSQMSRNSSDSRLSIVISDENSKMEVCEDVQSKSSKSNDSSDKSKHKTSDRHKSRSESKSDRDRKSSKDSKSRHSSSSKDKDKSRDRKDSKSTSTSSKSEKEKDKPRDKNDKDRNKSSGNSFSKHDSHSSSNSSSSSKDKSTKKDSSRSDKDKDKDKNRPSSSHKDSRSRDKSSDSRSKEKSSSSDKQKHSSHSDKYKKEKDNKDKKKEKSKDDHYSSKDKKNDRRSTDRDSNDGQSSKQNSSSNGNETHSSQTQKTTQETISGGGDSGNSDHTESTTKAPVNITGEVQNSEVTISPPDAQRMKVFKPKCASNMQEALRLRKIRKQLAKLEKQNQLSFTSVDLNSSILLSASINLDDLNQNHVNEKLKQETLNSKMVSELEVVPSPLQNTVISQDNWDAMEAKLREEVCSEFKEFQDDSLDSSVEEETKMKEKPQERITDEPCKYFDSVDISKIEFLVFVKKLIKDWENHENVIEKKTSKRKVEDNDLKNNNNSNLQVVPDKKAKLKKTREKINNHTVNEKFPLPPSPAESDKSTGRREDIVTPLKVKRNNVNKASTQRYSSEDLYKPRPTFASSRRRSAKNLEN